MTAVISRIYDFYFFHLCFSVCFSCLLVGKLNVTHWLREIALGMKFSLRSAVFFFVLIIIYDENRNIENIRFREGLNELNTRIAAIFYSAVSKIILFSLLQKQ